MKNLRLRPRARGLTSGVKHIAAAGTTYIPGDVPGLEAGVAQIAAGYMHFCALMAADGTMKCWGFNQNGQLGDQPASLPINLYGDSPVEVLDVG